MKLKSLPLWQYFAAMQKQEVVIRLICYGMAVLLMSSCIPKHRLGSDAKEQAIVPLKVEKVGVCPAYSDALDRDLLIFARQKMDKDLLRRLMASHALDLHSELTLRVCYEEISVRATWVALVLYALAEPDYMTVKASLSRDDQLLQQWTLHAENAAGGYTNLPSQSRRTLMLNNIIVRKLMRELAEVKQVPAEESGTESDRRSTQAVVK